MPRFVSCHLSLGSRKFKVLNSAIRKIPRHVIHAPFILLFDVLLINLGFFLALWLGWGRFVSPADNVKACLHMAPFASVAAVVLFFVSDLYGAWWMRTATEVAYSITSGLSILTVVTMAGSFWARELAFPRSVIITATFFQIVLVAACRLSLRRWHLHVEGRRRALILAD